MQDWPETVLLGPNKKKGTRETIDKLKKKENNNSFRFRKGV